MDVLYLKTHFTILLTSHFLQFPTINADINYRHSRTPSVCQYKHQSLVFIYFVVQIYSPGSRDLTNRHFQEF